MQVSHVKASYLGLRCFVQDREMMNMLQQWCQFASAWLIFSATGCTPSQVHTTSVLHSELHCDLPLKYRTGSNYWIFVLDFVLDLFGLLGTISSSVGTLRIARGVRY